MKDLLPGWHADILKLLTYQITPSKINIPINFHFNLEKLKTMGKWQQMKCSSVLGPGSHTKDTYSVDAQDNTLKQCQSSLKKGCQLPGPQTLRASPSGLLKKLLACCVWFTIFHLAFYKLYQSTGCNSSNFFHSSHAM